MTETLNIWDRMFNRYRKVVSNRGTEKWKRYVDGKEYTHLRDYVEYTVTDRVTGSETIQREYLI
jgi:hypothetical protein